MNIFELSHAYQDIMHRIDQVDEITDEMMQELESINDGLEEKLLNYASLIKNLEAKNEAILKAQENLEARSLRLTKSLQRLKDRVKSEMIACNKARIENEYHELVVCKNSPRVEIVDKEKIPQYYMRHKIKEVLEPDKMEIRKVIEAGIEVPGAYVVREERVEIR